MQTTNLKNLGLTFQDAKAATRLLKLPKALILSFFSRCFVDHQRVETERLESSVDRYKQKIHHMEFKTGELEARLNRKEQMIAKLENDLREVSYFSAVVSFLSSPSFFLFCFVLFVCLFVCFKWRDAKYRRTLAKRTLLFLLNQALNAASNSAQMKTETQRAQEIEVDDIVLEQDQLCNAEGNNRYLIQYRSNVSYHLLSRFS